MQENKGTRYRKGELELILSLSPTKANIDRLATSLGRSAAAIEIVYRLAYQPGQRFGATAEAQRKKISKAKESLGLTLF